MPEMNAVCPIKALRTFDVDALRVNVFSSRGQMGAASAQEGAAALRAALREKETVNVMFAAAPSQQELLDALIDAQGIEWPRVHAFHMDNYVGLPDDAPQQFSRFLKDRLFDRLPFGAVYCMYAGQTDPLEEASRYAQLLRDHPIDLCFMGVGENGHIAFNDPSVAQFGDPLRVKLVELDDMCRGQQVHDGCFDTISAVPTHALTATITQLMSARRVICTVPDKKKAHAIRDMLKNPVSERCPASVLRRHPHAVLYLDRDASSLLEA